MHAHTKAVVSILAMIAGIALGIEPAAAHRFTVALVVPLSDGASVEGRHIREGFMLATTEQDSHPDQESDGHLGGLDVYVTVIEGQGDVAGRVGRIARQGKADIVAAFVSEDVLEALRDDLVGTKTALLPPGQAPFANPDLPAVAAFVDGYERAYGYAPTPQAAQGYNAARRIASAVRAQGGVDNTDALRRSLAETARDFDW